MMAVGIGWAAGCGSPVEDNEGTCEMPAKRMLPSLLTASLRLRVTARYESAIQGQSSHERDREGKYTSPSVVERAKGKLCHKRDRVERLVSALMGTWRQ
jgi:hypothetical protein